MTLYTAHILGPDTHANRPAANTVPDGAQYVCSDHNIIYRNNSGTWGTWWAASGDKQETLIIALGDETTAITTGTAKVTFRMPWAMNPVTAVRASLTTVSSSGTPTFDINETGSGSILSTKLTIDASEKTSTTAATPAVISDTALADDAEITIDIDVAGTGATGAKIYITGTRV